MKQLMELLLNKTRLQEYCAGGDTCTLPGVAFEVSVHKDFSAMIEPRLFGKDTFNTVGTKSFPRTKSSAENAKDIEEKNLDYE